MASCIFFLLGHGAAADGGYPPTCRANTSGCAPVAEATAGLRLGRVAIYRRIRRYRQRPQTSSLLAENAYHISLSGRPILVNDLTTVMSFLCTI